MVSAPAHPPSTSPIISIHIISHPSLLRALLVKCAGPEDMDIQAIVCDVLHCRLLRQKIQVDDCTALFLGCKIPTSDPVLDAPYPVGHVFPALLFLKSPHGLSKASCVVMSFGIAWQ